MSNEIQAATVEVLTAEVRTLQVGARQVTMSVFEQLDAVEPLQVEPFGRVRRREHCPPDADRRVSLDCPDLCCVDVVGRDVTSGALVRSCAHWGPYRAIDRRERRTMAARWEALPLIVLAGLR